MKTERHPLGLYVHIPFCRSKCIYCDFYSLTGREALVKPYTRALRRHLEEVAPSAAGHRVDTVYFGGGTPSLLGPRYLGAVLGTVQKHYRLSRDAEVTLEANPESAQSWHTLRRLRRAGFNRLSLGVQSADDAILRAIGRVHTWDQAVSAVAAARRGGLTSTFDQLNKFFTISGMPVASSQYWNSIHGRAAGEAAQDEEGLQTMRTLARNMTFLMKSIALGREAYGLPEKEAPAKTDFIR